jgi:4-aminobutyrate--pyruvate transaminase
VAENRRCTASSIRYGESGFRIPVCASAAGIGPLIQQSAMDRGVLLRAAPDAVYVCPPLIIARAEIDELVDALKVALDDGYAEAVRRGLVGGGMKQAVG